MTNEETKHCPKCKEEVKSDAKKCKHCGADFRKWFARHKILSIILGFILLSAVINASSDNNSANNKTENYFPNAAYKETNNNAVVQKKLELITYNCYAQYDFFHIEGQVKNISDKPLDGVMVVGTAYTETQEFVKSEDALIDYNPILVGQTSPFEIIMTGNPAIARCNIDFKELFGGTIPTKRSNN